MIYELFCSNKQYWKKENIQFATNWTCIATTTSFTNGDQSCKSINFTSLEIIGKFCRDVFRSL